MSSPTRSFFCSIHHHLDVEALRDYNLQRYRIRFIGFVTLIVMAVYSSNPIGFYCRYRNASVSPNETDEITGLPEALKLSETTFSSTNQSAPVGMGCPDFQLAYDSAEPGRTAPFRSFTITKGSGHVSVQLRFSKLWVPDAVSVMLRSVEGYDTDDQVLNLSASYPSGRNYGHVISPPVVTKELRIEFYRENRSLNTKEEINLTADTFSVTDKDSKCFGFVIDSYDYELDDQNDRIVATGASICVTDNTVNAICCYTNKTTQTAYLAARSVARLKILKGINEWAYCTGWMLGKKGHILTNNHCVATANEAKSTSVEFMAEDLSCSDRPCDFDECPGDVVASSTEFVLTSVTLDYALLKLPIDGAEFAQKYGYLRLKTRAGVVGEQLYIPQYPMGSNKRIAIEDDYASKVALLSLNASTCETEGYSYSGDTQTGSSGSPVISYSDHGVVALHHCGKLCANTGIPAKDIVADLHKNGLDVAAFDMIDNGVDLEANAARFGQYTPPTPNFAQPKSVRLTLDGAITLSSRFVTIDIVTFTLSKDTHVSFAVLSVEIADNGTFIDLNGDCHATYLDSVLYLFSVENFTLVFFLDDCNLNEHVEGGSVSFRDPHKKVFLKKGSYYLAIAPTGSSFEDVLAGRQKISDTPELYSCRSRSSYGSYRLQICSTVGDDPFQFTSLPPTVGINPKQCQKPAKAICSDGDDR